MDIGKDMAEKITHRIRISHHIKKHHRAYVLGGFSIFAIVQTISLLSGIFSKASHDFMISDNPIIQSINEFEETSSFLGLENNLQDEISGISSIANIFSDFFDGNINNDLEEEESENTEKEIVSLDINNIQTFVLDDPWDEDFDKLSGDILDFSRDSDLVQDSKVLKNISIEKSQKNNNTISVQIPKDTFVKEIVSSSSLGKPRELNYKGEILAPQELSQDWLKLNRIKADYAFEVGNSNDKIIFKDEYGSESFVKISVELDPDKFSANEKVWIKSSNDQVSRDNLGTYPVQQKIEDKKEILFVEFVVNHMTTFLIGKDDFNFFLGEDSSCKKSLTEYSPGQKVYACVEGENMRLLNWMRFSFDERNLERESWFGFQNGYEIILPRDFGNSLVLYLNYSEDKTNYELIAHSIYQKGLVLDLNLILGDRDCNPLREIDSRSLDQVYLCLDGKDLSQIKEMKFAESLADLDKEIRQRFRNGQQISLSPKAEGEVTIYAYFGPNEFQYMFLTSSVIVKALDNEWGYMVHTGVRVSQSTDFSNKYREITSQDGRSKLAINTLGKEVNLFVGNRDWDGLVMSPVSITDTRKAKKGDPGLAPNFIPQETFLVGSEQSSLTLDNDQQFDISLFVSSASPGDVLDMYYSEDGTNWISSPSQCIVGQDRVCSFKSSHMTLFAVGTLNRQNMDFVNQRFRAQNPSNKEIIDAFFGSGSTLGGMGGGSTTAYNWHWNKSLQGQIPYSNLCRPTTVTFQNPGTRSAFTVPANTIYVLRSGQYIQNGTITMNSCSALVGIGDVSITKNGTFHLINASSKNQIILDNLSLNGNNVGATQHLIYLNSVNNFTINDVQVYNSASHGVNISAGTDGLINNSQFFNNNVFGLYLLNSNYNIINNSRFFNNGNVGLAVVNGDYASVNNSQIFNNGNHGIHANGVTRLIVNNTQSYKNNGAALYATNSPYLMVNDVGFFHSPSSDLSLSNASSSVTYYGNNLIPKRSGTNIFAGSAYSNLGWTAGTLNTVTPAYDCDLVSNPVFNNSYFYASNCNFNGRNTNRTVGTNAIVKYKYGDNFLGGKHVLKQKQPVNYYSAEFFTLTGGSYFDGTPELSSIPYHGHRFVGEYDDPKNRDINKPILLFDSSNPPDGSDISIPPFSNGFTIKTYIHEPNLAYLPRTEIFAPNNQAVSHTAYDDSLALMFNFDNIKEIGDTESLIRDLSKRKNKGTINGGLTWTSNGKRNGAYQFNGIDSYITIPTLSDEYLKKLDDFTVSFWIKATVPSNTVPIIDARAVTQGFGINLTNNGRIQHYINGAGHAQYSNYVADNNRHNVIITRQTNTVIVYIDGIKKSTWNNGVSTQLSLSDQITIGYDPDNIAGNVYFSGLLDEFRLYKRALTTNEIAHFYNSNLSAKANNWEYIVNYLGVGSWAQGYYHYLFNGVKDEDLNTATNTGGHVIKGNTCNGVFSINWNINKYLSGDFWSQNPTDCDIIYALYGTGGDKTNYANHCVTPGCHWSDITVQYLSPGTNQIPQFLNPKTIYVLSPGNYIQTYSVNMQNDCTALVGGSGTVTWYNNTSQYEQLYMKGMDIVVDNIVFHGSGNGIGGFVSPHSRAIDHDSTRCSTVNNVNIFGHEAFGIFSEGGNLKVSNSNVYDIWGDGALLRLNLTSFIENTKIYNGRGDGIVIVGPKNKIYSGTEIFNINGTGIVISGANEVFVDDVQIYNNYGAGISILGASHYHVFNNVKIFDNNLGIATPNDGGDPYSKDYNTLNNSQIFNNNKHGLSICRTKNFTINNTHVYNNGENGIYFAGNNNSGGILNDVFSYNNGEYGIRSEGGSHTRYGLLTTFENVILGSLFTNGTLSAGNSSTYAYLGRTGGTTDTTPCMNCSWVSNPRTSIGSQYMIDTTLYPKCDVRGNIATWTGTIDTSYRYGVSLTGQQKPVFWYDNFGVPTFTGIFVQFPGPSNDILYNIDYDINKYVAQDNNKISPDYTNTQCTCTDVANYPWNNDNFLNGQFWGSLPTYKPYCHIIAALYGSGTNGSDRTAYTQFWNNWTGACNVENMEVVYTGVVPQNLADNTIYVVSSGTQNISASRNMANCSAIIGLGDVVLRKTSGILAISSNSKTNWIIENVDVNGNGQSNYGIYVYNTSPNNTINNIDIYRNNNYGMYMAGGSHYNMINNSNFYNNTSFGLYLATQRNVVNNAQIYNNNNHGLVINNSYNTISNLQSYNNRNYGIYAGSTNNVYNNTQTYNNSVDGIRFMTNTNTNVINNFMAYNNAGMGINTQNYQVTYFGDNRAFDNGGANTGSNLIAGSSSPLGRTNGTLAGGTLTWDFITNPLNSSNTYLLNWSGDWSSLRGRLVSYYNAAVPTQKYSYGSGIWTQIQPVYYDNTTLKTGGLFATNKYIGSDTPKVSGTLLGLPATFSASNVNVSGNSVSDLVGKYSIFGDVMSYIIESNIGTNTGINLVLGLPQNRVVTQLLGGNNWINVGSVGFSAGAASSQSLAIDGSGTPYVAYIDNANGYKTTVMKYNGSSWVNVGTPGFSAGAADYQSLAIDGSGTPYVAYRDNANGYKTTVMKYNGSSRVNVGSVGFSAGNAYYQSLAIDGSGTPYVAYSDNANSNKTTVMKYNGSSRVNVGSVGFSAGNAYYQSLAIDGSGTPYVAYSNNANLNKTTVMKYNGSSWVNVGTPGFSAGAADYQSLAIDGSGTPYVAYRDNANLNKTTVMKYNGSSRVNVGSVGFSAGNASSQSLAIDGSGTPYVAYRDNANGYKTTVMSFNEEYFATHFQNDTEYSKCMSGWDNDNFLDDSFWSQNPSDANILCALYGSGGTDQTAYTQMWKGGIYADECDVANMSVVHVTNPISVPFGTMNSNTVYVFQSGTHYLSNHVSLGTCVAFVSSGETKIANYDDYNISIDNPFVIIDNINIYGDDYARYGITLSSKWDTLHNMDIYNNVELGIRVKDSSENLLKNINIFDNDRGIYGNPSEYIIDDVNVHNNTRDGILFEYPEHNIINNSKIYNNGGNGINIYGGRGNSINNTLIFNNDGGLLIEGSGPNLINNSMLFSNATNGLILKTSDLLMARSYVYNNGGYGIIVDGGSSLEYFDDNYVFDNLYGPFDIVGGVFHGSPNSSFNWGNGVFYDDGGSFNLIDFRTSRDYLVNPVNNTNQYMLDWIHRYDLLVGNFVFNSNSPIKYSYGSGIITQSVPVLFYAGVGLGTGGSFDSDKFIGSNVDKYAGALQMPAYISGTTITVTGTADPNDVNKYNLYSTEHLTTNYIGNNINNPVNITLNNGDGGKKIVTQIENTNNAYFATHFERETILDTSAPVTTDNANSVWRKTDFLVTLNAVDGGIGVDYTLYCITTTPTGCTPNITGTSANVTCAVGNTCPAQYVRYRSVDLLGNWESIKTSVVIRIDKQNPSFTFSSNSGPECVAGSLNIVSASDIGVGLHTSPYSFNGSTWGTTTSTSITAQQPGTQNRTAYVRDALLNIGNQSATYTFTDSMPTANDFTGHANVGDSTQTGNWKILSNAIDGACGSGDISLDGIVYQGQKGICNVVGDEISYTPNINQFGNDSCAIKIKDNENNTVNVIVYWENINTMSNPIIFFTGVNPVDNIVWDRNRYTSQIQIEQTQNMDVFEYNFSGTNYSVYDSGLILMMNLNNINLLGESAGSVVKDFSMNDNSSFVYAGSTWTGNGVWGGAYYFDGNGRIRVFGNEYNFSDQSDFSASIRFYVSDVPSNGDNMGIFGKRNGGRTAAWAIDYHYGTSNDYLRAGIRNGSVRTYTIPGNQRNMRYHVTFVHTSDKISSLYINGQFISSGSYSTSWSLSDGDLFLGSSISSIGGNPTNFIGMLDEPRIYNRALSAQEIQFLYKSNLRKFDTDKWMFETLNTCLFDDSTYVYTGYVRSIFGQYASTGRVLNTDIPNLYATGLSNFDFGVDQVSSSVQIKTGQYNDYIEVHDKIANTGWRLTVSASNQLLGQENSFNIASSNLFFMPNNLDLLSGSSLPNTLGLNPSLENRSNIHVTPIDYFIKDFDPNDFMCDEGVFGDKPHLKLNIPAHQAPDTYVGTLYINIAP